MAIIMNIIYFFITTAAAAADQPIPPDQINSSGLGSQLAAAASDDVGVKRAIVGAVENFPP